MRIGEFTDSFLPITDGVGRVVHHYATSISKKEHECYVIAPMNETGYRGGYPFELIEYASKSLVHMPQYRSGIPSFDKHYKKRLEMVDFDIIHVHSPFSSGLDGAKIASKRKIPLVGTFHSKYYDDFLQVTKNASLAKLGTKFVVNFYNRCDEVWTMSEPAAQTLAEYGYKKKIKIVPNGTDVYALNDSVYDQLMNRYDIAEGELIFLYAGQINYKKNLQLILDAVLLFSQKHTQFKFIIAGKGAHYDDIRKWVYAHHLEEHVIFTGHLADLDTLNALYAMATLFLFPSLYDTNGLVTREAAAMGTPSVVIKDTAAADGILHMQNGLLCEDSVDSLMESMCFALKNKEKLRELGLRALDTLPIPWDAIADQVLHNYERLVAVSNATPT